MKILQRIAKLAQQALLPNHCLLCLNKTTLDISLCHACMLELPWLKRPCYSCAYPLTVHETNFCGACLKRPPPYQRLIALFDYQDPIRKFITALKFQQHLQYAHLFTLLMIEYLIKSYAQQTLPELIIPVPLHKKRIQQRGFNQALEIARPIAQQLSIPINYRLLQRVRHTQAQSDLPAKLRPHNVNNAFHVDANIKSYKHVAIIDDVITTGSTVKAIVKTIQRVAPIKIDVWTVARTQSFNSK